MVVGGEVATLRALEETSGLIITEMPISVSFCTVLTSYFLRRALNDLNFDFKSLKCCLSFML